MLNLHLELPGASSSAPGQMQDRQLFGTVAADGRFSSLQFYIPANLVPSDFVL